MFLEAPFCFRFYLTRFSWIFLVRIANQYKAMFHRNVSNVILSDICNLSYQSSFILSTLVILFLLLFFHVTSKTIFYKTWICFLLFLFPVSPDFIPPNTSSFSFIARCKLFFFRHSYFLHQFFLVCQQYDTICKCLEFLLFLYVCWVDPIFQYCFPSGCFYRV